MLFIHKKIVAVKIAYNFFSLTGNCNTSLDSLSLVYKASRLNQSTQVPREEFWCTSSIIFPISFRVILEVVL